jgi:hypothetical protein
LGSIRAFLPLTSAIIEDDKEVLSIGTGQLSDHPSGIEDIEQDTSSVRELIKALSLGFLSPTINSKQCEEREPLKSAQSCSASITRAMALGFMQILPGCDDQGRTLIWIEPRKLEGPYSRAGILHSIWFLLHFALHIVEQADVPSKCNVDPQKFGLVFLIYLRDADPFRHFDISLVQSCAESIRGALPVRVSAIHFLEPPLLFDALYEVIQLLLGDLLKKRIHVHSYRWGSKYEVGIWERFGISLQSLPSEIGGDVTMQPKIWMNSHGFKGIEDSLVP